MAKTVQVQSIRFVNLLLNILIKLYMFHTWGPLDPKIWGGGAESMKESDSYLELSNKSIIDTSEFTFI